MYVDGKRGFRFFFSKGCASLVWSLTIQRPIDDIILTGLLLVAAVVCLGLFGLILCVPSLALGLFNLDLFSLCLVGALHLVPCVAILVLGWGLSLRLLLREHC